MTSRRSPRRAPGRRPARRRACQPNGSPACSQATECQGPAADHEQVRRDRRRGREVPDAVVGRGRPAVAEHRPVLGGATDEGHRRLEVGLVEAREDPLREVAAAERGEVRRAVGRIDVPVHPVAGGDAGERRLDHQLVVREQPVQPDPVALAVVVGHARAVQGRDPGRARPRAPRTSRSRARSSVKRTDGARGERGGVRRSRARRRTTPRPGGLPVVPPRRASGIGWSRGDRSRISADRLPRLGFMGCLGEGAPSDGTLRDRRGRYLRDAPCRSRPVRFSRLGRGQPLSCTTARNARRGDPPHVRRDQDQGRVPHRVRQGRGPPHPPRQQGARRHLRPRQRPDPRDPARPRHDDGDQARRRQRAARARHRRQGAAGADQADPVRPDQGLPRAHRLRRGAQGEKVTVDVAIHLVGEAAAARPWSSPRTRPCPLEAEATHIPEFIEVSIEGADVGTQIHASDLVLPRARSCSATPTCWSST